MPATKRAAPSKGYSKTSHSKMSHPKSSNPTTTRSSKSKATIDHDEIRKWAEARGGHPATVKATETDGEPGLLRIDFPGYRGVHTLEEITWDEFFEKFDEMNLAFLYQEKTAAGKPSRFCKLVSRNSVKARSR